MKLMPQFQEPRSRPIVKSPASTPVPRPSESTSDPGLARYPRLKAEARMAPRCRYTSTTSQAVNPGCGSFVKKREYATPSRVRPTGLFFSAFGMGGHQHATAHALGHYRPC